MTNKYKEIQFINRKNVFKAMKKLIYSQNPEKVSSDYLQAVIDIKIKVQKMNSHIIKVPTKDASTSSKKTDSAKLKQKYDK